MDHSGILPTSDDHGSPLLPPSSGPSHPSLFDFPSPPPTSLPESLLMQTDIGHPPLPTYWPYAQMDRNVSAAVMERIASSGQTGDLVFPIDFSGSPAFGLSDANNSLINQSADPLVTAARSVYAANGGFTGASGAVRTSGMNQAATSVVITPATPSLPVHMSRILPLEVLRAASMDESQRARVHSLIHYLPGGMIAHTPLEGSSPSNSPLGPDDLPVGPPNVNPFGGPVGRQRASVIQTAPSIFTAVEAGEARDIHPPVRSAVPPIHPPFHNRIHELEPNSQRSHRLAVQEYIRSMQRTPRVQMLAANQHDGAPVQSTSGMARPGSGRSAEGQSGVTHSSPSVSRTAPQGFREHRSQVIYHDARGRSIPFFAIHRTENRAPVTVASGSSSQTSAVPSYSGFYQPVFRPVEAGQQAVWNPHYGTATGDTEIQTESSAGRTTAFDQVSQRRLLRTGACPYARPPGQSRPEAPHVNVEWFAENEASSSTRDVERSQAAFLAATINQRERIAQRERIVMEERAAALRQRHEHASVNSEQYPFRGSVQDILRAQHMSNAEQRRRLIYIPQNQPHGGPPSYGRIAASLLQFMDAGAIFMHTDGEPKLILEEDVISAIAVDTQSFEFDNQFPHNEECIICFEEFELKQEVRILSCNKTHRFHKHCIDKWLIKNKPNCPICRQILPSLNQPKDTAAAALSDHHPLRHDPAVLVAGPSLPMAEEWS